MICVIFEQQNNKQETKSTDKICVKWEKREHLTKRTKTKFIDNESIRACDAYNNLIYSKTFKSSEINRKIIQIVIFQQKLEIKWTIPFNKMMAANSVQIIINL